MVTPQEIEKIEDIGEINGQPIKMIQTIGGLFIATGVLPGRNKQEVLAQGSHRGIVKYSLEKKFAGQAAFALQKNISAEAPIRDYSERLPELMRKHGYELLTSRGASGVVAFLNKDGKDVSQYVALQKGEEFFVQEPIFSRIPEAKMAQALGVTKSALEALLSDALILDGKKMHVGPFEQGKPHLTISIKKS